MKTPRWIVALALAVGGLAPVAGASEIHDRADLFSKSAVEKAQAQLDRVERASKLPVTIETITSLKDATTQEQKDSWHNKKAAEVINLLARQRALEGDRRGIYVLISKDNHLISNVEVSERAAARLPERRRSAIRDSFTSEFKAQNFDGGLMKAVQEIQDELSPTKVAANPAPVVPGRAGGPAPAGPRAPGGLSLMSLVPVILIIVAVLVGVRLLSSLFRGNANANNYPGPGGPGGPGRMGGPGYGGPGYGQGYGGPGYGAPQPRGGFMSSLFGGLGGAVAGNWLYDQFSGRSHHTDQAGGYTGGESLPDATAGGGDMIGADDNGGQGASWGESGGDWTSGGTSDAGGGGGGDWGGGGGGGGDWGGGGGGDWGGGGDGGGGGDW